MSLSLDFNFAGGDDLGAGTSARIQIGDSTAQTINRPGALSSPSSSESTLRFFDLGEGGTSQFKSAS
jgi:hypothetical protein